MIGLVNKRPYKFFVSKSSAVLSIIIIILSLSAIFILDLGINTIEGNAVPVSTFENNYQTGNNSYNSNKDKVFLSSVRDIFVVVCSIFGTNLLLSISFSLNLKTIFMMSLFQKTCCKTENFSKVLVRKSVNYY